MFGIKREKTNKIKYVYEYLEEISINKPDDIALVFGDESMTYSEVNRRVNQFAHYLIQRKVSRGDVIALLTEKSFEMVISIFAIIKVGAAYLPIDFSNPPNRVNYFLENSNVKFVITDNSYDICNIRKKCNWIYVNDWSLYSNLSTNSVNVKVNYNDIAYVIYTSGSTGIPKGVMIEHQALDNRLRWMIENFKFNCNDVFLQKTSYAFDVSVWEIFCWCMVGAKLVILQKNKEKNPRTIFKAITNNSVTVVHFVPSVLDIFLEYISDNIDLSEMSDLRYVIASGEELLNTTVQRFNEKLWKNNGTELWNLYGPTESTIDVTSFCCVGLNKNVINVPIGKVVWNVKAYVLDENLLQVNDDEKGELYLGGIQLARGYCNNRKLTKERFIRSPFDKKEILYKTGDLVSINSDGLITYYGRIDSQVKISGLRIELGEIEKYLNNIEGIKKAVVIVDDKKTFNKTLVALYVGEREILLDEVIEHLSGEIPNYMFPSKIIRVGGFELNVNGKLDKSALKEYL